MAGMQGLVGETNAYVIHIYPFRVLVQFLAVVANSSLVLWLFPVASTGSMIEV